MVNKVDDYGLVSFLPLDLTDEDTIMDIIYNADSCLQYTENLEPREEDYEASEKRMREGQENNGEM